METSSDRLTLERENPAGGNEAVDRDQFEGKAAAVATRVLIVDDAEVFRSRAKRLVEAAGYDVVGEAADARGAIEQCRLLNPDVVLLDVQLPDGDGFSVAEMLDAESPKAMVVLLSSREASDYGSLIERAPAVGFIYKPDLCRMTLQALVGKAS